MSSRFPLLLYIGAIILITIIFASGLLAKAYAGGLNDWTLGLTGALSLLCGSQLAVALVNRLVTLLATPPTYMRFRHTAVAVDGHGTRGQPAGCTG